MHGIIRKMEKNDHLTMNIYLEFMLAWRKVRCSLLAGAVQWLGGEDEGGSCSEAVCGDN